MSNINERTGIAPAIRDEFEKIHSAMSGDLEFSISPATATQEPTTDAWERDVTIKLVDSGGAVQGWYSGTLACAIADSSTDGTAALDTGDSAPAMVNGVAEVTVKGSGAWIDNDTDTMTLSNKTILGYTVTGGTSVQTTST